MLAHCLAGAKAKLRLTFDVHCVEVSRTALWYSWLASLLRSARSAPRSASVRACVVAMVMATLRFSTRNCSCAAGPLLFARPAAMAQLHVQGDACSVQLVDCGTVAAPRCPTALLSSGENALHTLLQLQPSGVGAPPPARAHAERAYVVSSVGKSHTGNAHFLMDYRRALHLSTLDPAHTAAAAAAAVAQKRHAAATPMFPPAPAPPARMSQHHDASHLR